MTKHLQKLAELGSTALSGAPAAMNEQLLREGGLIARDLQWLLNQKNGFVAFESSLHVLPLGLAVMSSNLSDWNSPNTWRDSYRGLADVGLYFAEDIFGNQFCARDDGIFAFDAETAETKGIASGLDQWAELILDDYAYWSGFPISHEWQLQNGALAPGSRLVPRRPFVLGGEYSAENLRAIAAARGMRWRGNLANQIHGLADGAQIKLAGLE